MRSIVKLLPAILMAACAADCPVVPPYEPDPWACDNVQVACSGDGWLVMGAPYCPAGRGADTLKRGLSVWAVCGQTEKTATMYVSMACDGNDLVVSGDRGFVLVHVPTLFCP